MTEQQSVFEKRFTLNFPGSQFVDFGQIIGPNLFGEWFRPISESYDALSNRTAVEFDIVPKDDVRTEAQRIGRNAAKAVKIQALFGGGSR